MKKIFAFVLAAVALVSCKMDFYPSDSMTSSQLAENPSSAVYTTDGIYTLFQDRVAYAGQTGGESGNYYIRHYFQFAELRGDNVTVSGKSEDPFTEAYMYEEDPTHKNIYYTWWMGYKIINAANSNIAAIVPGTSALSDHLLGENYFFRALVHFHLVTLFAMPYVQGRDNPGVVLRQGSDISTTTRSTVGEVYDAIVEDLLKAKEYLAIGESERVKGDDKSYVTLDAATALLARVYLYMEKNDECIEQCNELLAHAPASVIAGYDYADYPTHTYNHAETIWCIRLDQNHDWAQPDHAEASLASMYVKDGRFKNLFKAQEFVCVPHYNMLNQKAAEKMQKGDLPAFQKDLDALVEEYVKQLNSDVNDFCNSFDYRNAGNLHKPEMEHVRSSIERSVEFLTGRKPKVK